MAGLGHARRSRSSIPSTPPASAGMGLLEDANPFRSPEAAGEHHYNPQFMSILNYTYPVTNRLLIQADAMRQAYHRHQKRQFGGTDARVTTDDIAVTDLGLNLNYGSRATGYTVFPDDRWHERISVSYVTGSHNFKTGIDLNQFSTGRKHYSDINQVSQARAYTFRNQVPVSVTIFAFPTGTYNTSTENGVYVQDQWTMRRLTLNLGLRYNDVRRVHSCRRRSPPGPWVPERELSRSEALAELEEPESPRRRGLRSVRHRQNRAEGVARAVSGAQPRRRRRQPGQQSGGKHDPELERRERQFRPRLRFEKPARAWRVRAVERLDVRPDPGRQYAACRRRQDGLQPSGLQLAGLGVVPA